MTIGEVNRYLQGCIFREERQMKLRANMDYRLAVSLVSILGASFNSKPTPSIYDLYPDLFEEDRTAKSVANFINFANSFNRKIKNKELTDDRRTQSHN